MEPSYRPLPSPSSDKKSNQSNSNPHVCISIHQSLVCLLVDHLQLIFNILSSPSQQLPTLHQPSPPPTMIVNKTIHNSNFNSNSNSNSNPKSLTNKSLLTTTIILVCFCFRCSASCSVSFVMVKIGCFPFRIRLTMKNRIASLDVEIDIVPRMGKVGVSKLSWDEVQICTNGLEKVIDYGGFSVVYYGTLIAKQQLSVVGAFKVHNGSERLNRGFKEELSILLKLDHPNIVKLHAYCDDQDRGALVFEYVPNGTLHENLHSSDHTCSLPWKKRVMIAYQLALALEYLHEQCELHIVHGDIKSTNILLDSNFNLKLCDFGSAKLGFSTALSPPHPSGKHLITGSPGYIDPHYLRTGIASKKNDMYSFGVVLLELLTGLEALCYKTGRMLTSRVLNSSGGVNLDLVDRRLGREYNLEGVRVMGELAARCIGGSPSLRPSAREVIMSMQQNCSHVLHAC